MVRRANYTTDASVLGSIQKFVLGLSQSSSQRLLSLYPVADFTRLVREGEQATVQYYRAAQINRDILFTCPVIDFTWQYAKGAAETVRLYEMNQTKFGPVFQHMGVPQWRVAHLSDIPYFMNEDVAAGGDNGPAQRELSTLLSGSMAAFAHTGDPRVSRGQTFKDWPTAYQDSSQAALRKDYPEALSLNIIGGPNGSGQATTTYKTTSRKISEREKALSWEKLIERCRFINSIQEEIGV